MFKTALKVAVICPEVHLTAALLSVRSHQFDLVAAGPRPIHIVREPHRNI